jgi:3-hydroxyisobutyrate dehydrogenase/2-hydroxy-3-oxopropionate reductase
MGKPMCRRLLAVGYPVLAFDIDVAALGEIVADGAEAADSASACAASADFFCTSLPTPASVEAVMAGKDGALAALRPGSTWIDLTTNSRESLLGLAAAANDGVQIVEAPVTGAVDGARTGKLTLFVGGNARAVAHAAPLLQQFGRVLRCGTLGSGNIVKLVTNQLWFVHAAALAEGFALGMANGVELEVLWDAIRDSVADSFVARHDAPSIFAGHYDPSFSLDLCLKDLGLIAELAKNVATDLPMSAAAHAAFRRAAERYGGGAGELHVARRIEDDAGIAMRLAGNWVPHWEK